MQKKILLITHNLNIEGAPISLFLIAKLLIKNNFCVEILSLIDGPLKEEYTKQGINTYLANKEPNFLQYDLVIVNTVVPFNYIKKLKDKIPTIWLIRESKNIKDELSDERLNIEIKHMPYIYCVSQMAKDFIDKEYNKNVKILHNYALDEYENEENIIKDKIIFSNVGLVCKRKGFDICINAFLELDEKYQNLYELNLVGKQLDYATPLIQKTQNYKNIKWTGVITGEKKKELYKKTNVFIISSREEPSSRIAIESCMLAKPLIVTENVGAKYLVNNDTGWIVKTESISDLKECIEKILDNNYDLNKMGKHARELYLKTSTEEIYEKNLLNIINYHINSKLIAKKTIFEYVDRLFLKIKRNYKKLILLTLSIK